MLETYRKLTHAGVIGPQMKVGPDGKTPLYDPGNELPGSLVARPFQEFPKAVRRVKVNAETGEEKIITLVAHSKAEELRIMSDTAELDAVRSPLERERDQLAEDLATQQKMGGQLASQLENALARLNEQQEQINKLLAAGGAATGSTKAEGVKPTVTTAKPVTSNAEAMALANKK